MTQEKWLYIDQEAEERIRKALTTAPTCVDDLVLQGGERIRFTVPFDDGFDFTLSVACEIVRDMMPELYYINAPVISAELTPSSWWKDGFVPGSYDTWVMAKTGNYTNLRDPERSGPDVFFRDWVLVHDGKEYMLHVAGSDTKIPPTRVKGYEIEVSTRVQVFVDAEEAPTMVEAVKKACEKALQQTPDEQDAHVLKVLY